MWLHSSGCDDLAQLLLRVHKPGSSSYKLRASEAKFGAPE
jgi:hypothetical protein